MATVYLARDLKHNRSVAIKVLRPDLAVSIGSARFIREIRIASRLTHPNILPLYDSGTSDGLLFYVMPHVAGESLRERIRREGPLPVDEAVNIAREVAEALDYAHQEDVVHRDIKPGNILLEAGRAVIADFGLARAIHAAADDVSSSGLAVGTPAYMSPEQSTGSDQVDGRSDIYSLGCVLFEMLAGEPPFTGSSAQSVAAKHLRQTPPSLETVRPNVPDRVLHAVRRALEKVSCQPFPASTGLRSSVNHRGTTYSANDCEPSFTNSVARHRSSCCSPVAGDGAGGQSAGLGESPFSAWCRDHPVSESPGGRTVGKA